MTEQYTIESELAKALVRFSCGKISTEEAKAKAKEVASNFDLSNEMLAHKGINWYAKQLLKYM